ncbi:MAG: hypothetical protein HDQ87_07730 [Clostridia bacterium]|nr:hypothetical protein [Clostridia bacterium]
MQLPKIAGPDKKVEYIELIYDLIFVFLLQQDNALLSLNEEGFFGPNEFETYLYSTLIVLEVWGSSILYINRYGETSFLDNCFLFTNMYLLYYMGIDTRLDWWSGYATYNTAWGLILINLAIQYLIRTHRMKGRHPDAIRLTRTRALVYLVEAGMVFLTIPIFHATGVSLVWLALLLGVAAPFITARIEHAVPISNEHLSERVMLFIVFTFGEMIVSISTYFEDVLSWQVLYFSLTSFAMVAGLFMSYGFLYNHVMDRHMKANGMIYLLLHIIIVIALSNVSVSLEHMRSLEIDEFQNAVFIGASLLAYYITLFLIARRTEWIQDKMTPFVVPAGILSAAFFCIICFATSNPWVVIGLCTAYVLCMHAAIVLRWQAVERKNAVPVEHTETKKPA